MQQFRPMLGLAITLVALSGQAAVASPEALRAADDLKHAGSCSVTGLGRMRELIKRYKKSADPDTQLVVAKGRYAEAFTHWFNSSASADLLLKRVIKRYNRAGNPKMEAIAADARITLVMTKRSPKQIRKYLSPIVARYADATDPDLARSYSKALFALSGVERELGHEAQAQRLYDAAAKVRTVEVTPNPPSAAPDDSEDLICV